MHFVKHSPAPYLPTPRIFFSVPEFITSHSSYRSTRQKRSSTALSQWRTSCRGPRRPCAPTAAASTSCWPLIRCLATSSYLSCYIFMFIPKSWKASHAPSLTSRSRFSHAHQAPTTRLLRTMATTRACLRKDSVRTKRRYYSRAAERLTRRYSF